MNVNAANTKQLSRPKKLSGLSRNRLLAPVVPKKDTAIYWMILIHWIEIYPMESAIQLLNNWGQGINFTHKVRTAIYVFVVALFWKYVMTSTHSSPPGPSSSNTGYHYPPDKYFILGKPTTLSTR